MFGSTSQPVSGKAFLTVNALSFGHPKPQKTDGRISTESLLPDELTRIESQSSRVNGQSNAEVDANPLATRLQDAVARTNEYLRSTETHLEFVTTEETGRLVVRVVDTESGDLVRQIPPEYLVRFSERLTELRGLLFDSKG